MSEFDAAGVKLYTLSYDEVDALADFAKAHGVTYSQLSDRDSRVIREFGILNTMIPSDDYPWYGIPYPGAFAIDADGVIRGKFFEHNFAVRAGPELLLSAALGKSFEVQTDGRPVEQVTVDVSFEGSTLPVGLAREIVARFCVPEGQHLYGEPVPEGLVAVQIELDENPGILTYTPVYPPTSALMLSGTGETLQVYEGDVVLRLPVAQNARATTKEDGKRWVTVSGRVRWQSCDDHACGLPESEPFSFRIESRPAVYYDWGHAKGRVPDMNGAAHFAKMNERHKG